MLPKLNPLSRKFVQKLPFGEGSAVDRDVPWNDAVTWPCSWIGRRGNPAGPWVAAFRCGFESGDSLATTIHVAADQLYRLYIDGELVALGGELGDKFNWYADSFELSLAKGRHVLVAQVINYGAISPWCMTPVMPGFFLCPESKEGVELMGTGVAAWSVKQLPGYGWSDATAQFGEVVGTGPCYTIDAREFAWDFAAGAGENWGPVQVNERGNNGFVTHPGGTSHWLRPATLPGRIGARVEGIRVRSVLEKESETFSDLPPDSGAKRDWQQLLLGEGAVTIAPRETRLVILELGNYYCAYPRLIASGGAGSEVSVLWAESMQPRPDFVTGKGSLLDVEGKSFRGYGDTFLPDGEARRTFEPLNWRCGCFVLVKIRNAEQALTLEALEFTETRYPLGAVAKFQSDDAGLTQIRDVALRTLEMCMHDTYMDCPFYERLMYIGDTRVQALITYTISLDDRLPRKALRLFDASRVNPEHLTLGSYPGSTKFIPPFALWWVGMIYDYALWRGDAEFVRGLMIGARTVAEVFLGYREASGLVRSPRGWNFVDAAFPGGVPEGGFDGVSALLNLQLALVLTQLSALENFLWEEELVRRWQRLARELMDKIIAAFWDEERGLMADDCEHRQFSEHGQWLVLLTDLLPAPISQRIVANLQAPDLRKGTIYFTHYLFEVAAKTGRPELFLERLTDWRNCVAADCRTFPEHIAPRSFCHAWSASPLYHFTTCILGLRPDGGKLGFETLHVRPALGSLRRAEGELPHRNGPIRASYLSKGDVLQVRLVLPTGLAGRLEWKGEFHELRPGENEISLALKV